MLETILDRHIIFVLMGILTAVGIMSKLIVNVSLKRLVRAAGNMNKSTHPLMRLVRAKFEHASMVSDKVENVKVFVDKYLYEYKVLGLRLHSWRRMEKASAALCLLTGAVGAGLEYAVNGMSDLVWKTGAVGGGLAAFVYLVHLLTDEKYQLEAVQNYMVDFLENVCQHRFEKSNQKEIKVLAQDGAYGEFGVMPADGQDNSGDKYAVRKKETAEDLFAVRNLEQADEHLYAAKSQGQGGQAYTAKSQDQSGGQAYTAKGQGQPEGQSYTAKGQSQSEGQSYNDQPEASYSVRNRDSSQGQSAVSAFLAAELKAGESVFRTQETEPDEAVNAFRTADLRVDEVANAFRMAESSQSKGGNEFRTQETSRNEGPAELRLQEAGQNDGISAFRMPEPIKSDGTDTFRTSEARQKESVEIETPRGREKRKENIVEIPVPELARETIEKVVIETPETSNPARNPQGRQNLQKDRMQRREKAEEEIDRDVVIRRILEEFMA